MPNDVNTLKHIFEARAQEIVKLYEAIKDKSIREIKGMLREELISSFYPLGLVLEKEGK